MDDSLFARLGNDPTRIFAHFYGQPAPGGIARLGGLAKPEEVPGDGPAPASAASADRPPGAEDEPTGSAAAPELPPQDREVAAASAADGGGSPPGAAPEDGSLHQAPPDPPHGAGEEQDAAAGDAQEYDVRTWLSEHWDDIQALVAARQGPGKPARSAPPGPEPAPPEEPAERPRVYVARGDRWNKWKMAQFLRHLAATHSVTAAARAVGMSRNSAYKLRARLKGQPFDVAWEAAFRHGYDDLPHAALELALEGEEVPHYFQGELVGTHRKRHPQLMMALLKMRNSAGAPMLGRYSAAAEYWSEHWDQITHRVETGSVTWSDERNALGEEELAKLDLPDEKRRIDLVIARNRPDEPRGP
jgi:hypothetical protein